MHLKAVNRNSTGIGLREVCRSILLLGCLLISFQGVQAQIDDGEDEGESPFSISDSTGRDSIKPQKEVRILTETFDLQALDAGRDPRTGVQFDLRQVLYFDPLERTDGFATTLGQLGKPYRRFKYGVDAAFLQEGRYINPYTGEEDVYMMDQEKEVKYYDTRTPFINIYFGQGKSDLSGLWVDVAQNVTPWWNLSILFRREQSDGTYSEFATSHHNIYVASNFRTRNERYRLFINGMFQELQNELNGGVGQIDSIPALFNKGSQPVSLAGADLIKRQQSIYLKQYYSLIKPDTVERANKLFVYSSIMGDYFINQYTDTIVSSTVQAYQFPIYLTLEDSTDFLYEKYQHNRWSFAEGLTYQFHKKSFRSTHQGKILNEITDFEKNLETIRLSKFTWMWNGDLNLNPGPFELNGEMKVQGATSNLFAAEALIKGSASIGFPKAVSDYTYMVAKEKRKGDPKPDSVLVEKMRRPWKGFLTLMNFDRNPSLQQAYGDGWEGNTFAGNQGFGNRRLELFKTGIEWNGKAKKTNYGGMPGSRVRFTIFRSRQYGMIYPNAAMVLQQAPDSAYLEFGGVELDTRFRFGKWSFESKLTSQAQTAVGDETLVDFYQNTQPGFYTRTKFYWEDHDLKIARAIRGGLEYYYFSTFNAPLFDAPSQMFYPQVSLEQKGYHRLDVFFSAQIKKAQIYFRVYNTLEGVFDNGYYTTLFYPMWDRNFMVGVNWSFYD